jgi:nicotinate phosphoribosyltransferase
MGVTTTSDLDPRGRADDPGLLTPAQAGLLVDQYELVMAASYLKRGRNEPATFELSVRDLPSGRRWLLAAGLGPTLRLIEEMHFGTRELSYLRDQGFDRRLVRYLERFRFSGDVDAMPEGTVVFAGEPLVRVTAPLVEAQLLETLLLNQISFQTAIATKAARIALAAGAGTPEGGRRVADFSARRGHGADAAMKAARCAALIGAAGTSNMAAAMRYGLRHVGTMAHSYVLSFATEADAFRAFLQDNPNHAVLLVDTYDVTCGVRAAIRASQETGITLQGVRLDSGDLLALSRATRRDLDDAGMSGVRIVASGDLDEHRIAELVSAGAPIDLWGVGTALGTSPDAPALSSIYKLVARCGEDGRWQPVAKRSPGKTTIGWPKQVHRMVSDGVMRGDVVAHADEQLETGEPLLRAAMRAGSVVDAPAMAEMQATAQRSLAMLPSTLRDPGSADSYPVRWSHLLGVGPRAGRQV